MTTALTCATLATLVSFTAAWLLARFSIGALMLCLPRGTGALPAQPAEGRQRP
jgi:hypothetical protein